MFQNFVKPHLWSAIKNFLFAFGTIWLFLESAAGFRWINTTTFGFWGYLNLVLFSMVASLVHTYLDFSRKAVVERRLSEARVRFPEILEFHASYRHTDWAHLIGTATHDVTVCAFYLDSWLAWVKEDLRAFLRRNATKLRVVLPRIVDDRRLGEIARLFPQYAPSLVRSKITQTRKKVEDILIEFEVPLSKAEFFEYPHFLNYSYILVDGEQFFLTIYEMERASKADAFSLTIDLRKNAKVRQFVEKENRHIAAASSRLQ